MSMERVTTLWTTLSKVFLRHGTQVFPVQVLKCFAHLWQSIQMLGPQQPLLNISATPLHRIWKIRYKLESLYVIQYCSNIHLSGISHLTLGLVMFVLSFVCFDAPVWLSFKESSRQKCERGEWVFTQGGAAQLLSRSEICHDNCQLEEMSVRPVKAHQ